MASMPCALGTQGLDPDVELLEQKVHSPVLLSSPERLMRNVLRLGTRKFQRRLIICRVLLFHFGPACVFFSILGAVYFLVKNRTHSNELG